MPSNLNKLCIHTITTRPWEIEQSSEAFSSSGIGGITVWRQALEGRNIVKTGDRLRNDGLEVVSLCRGGFFPATSASRRKLNIDDNLQALDEAAALGAPLIVLVCGADPDQPLATSRDQIRAGLEAIIPRAEELNIKLAIEPLHPMYAADRACVNTLAQANDLCDELGDGVGIALDVYHVWWDPDLARQIARAGRERLLAFHVCDWLVPTTDLLLDRGMMGDGVIDIPGIRGLVEATGYDGLIEVEIFSANNWWVRDPDEVLRTIVERASTAI